MTQNDILIFLKWNDVEHTLESRINVALHLLFIEFFPGATAQGPSTDMDGTLHTDL